MPNMANFGVYPENDYTSYEALCIHGVIDLNADEDTDETNCKIDDTNPQFYSIYGKLKGLDEVECLGDFQDFSLATYWELTLSQLHSLPIRECSLSKRSKS